MRYINTAHIPTPNNWVDLARTQSRNSGYPPSTSLWSYFKADFEAIAGKKCWYSESSNIGSKNPIDHFRPKTSELKAVPQYGQIDGITNRINMSVGTGYPFLEFEFSNYRYACDIVNSPNKKDASDKLPRGKWDYFPIAINSIRATSLQTIGREQFCLIDPCVQEEAELLTFTELGQIEAHKSVLKSSWQYCKVKVSIELFHLHYPKFSERRREIWTECLEHIELLGDLYYKNPRTIQEQNNVSYHLKELVKKISKKSEFSAVAIDCIKHYRNTYTWLNNLFTEEMLKK